MEVRKKHFLLFLTGILLFNGCIGGNNKESSPNIGELQEMEKSNDYTVQVGVSIEKGCCSIDLFIYFATAPFYYATSLDLSTYSLIGL